MKTSLNFPASFLFSLVLISCSADSPKEQQEPEVLTVDPVVPVTPAETSSANESFYFGFLDGGGSSNTFIDMPVESSSTNLLIGRWQIVKGGLDENNDGTIKYYYFKDYNNQVCGFSFLQFNNNGIVFENVYYNDNGTCYLYSEIDNYELIEANRLKIYNYSNIYLVSLTATELIIKYDWAFENSLYGPAQVYYYYERI